MRFRAFFEVEMPDQLLFVASSRTKVGIAQNTILDVSIPLQRLLHQNTQPKITTIGTPCKKARTTQRSHSLLSANIGSSASHTVASFPGGYNVVVKRAGMQAYRFKGCFQHTSFSQVLTQTQPLGIQVYKPLSL